MSDLSIVIGPVRLSYANVWEPKLPKGGTKPVYSVSCLIDKNDLKNVEIVKKGVDAATAQGLADKKWPKVPPKFWNPLQNGDEPDTTGNDKGAAYKGMYHINAKNENAPEIIDAKTRQKIFDENVVYSGCWAYVAINLFPFNTQGAGIGASLQHIMFVKDGPRLDNRKSADEMFKGITFDESTIPDVQAPIAAPALKASFLDDDE